MIDRERERLRDGEKDTAGEIKSGREGTLEAGEGRMPGTDSVVVENKSAGVPSRLTPRGPPPSRLAWERQVCTASLLPPRRSILLAKEWELRANKRRPKREREK